MSQELKYGQTLTWSKEDGELATTLLEKQSNPRWFLSSVNSNKFETVYSKPINPLYTIAEDQVTTTFSNNGLGYVLKAISTNYKCGLFYEFDMFNDL